MKEDEPGLTIILEAENARAPKTAGGNRLKRDEANGRRPYRLRRALNWRPPVERYLGKQVQDKGFKNFWGLEHWDLVYKGWKGDGAFSYEDEELNRVPEVVLAYRQAA